MKAISPSFIGILFGGARYKNVEIHPEGIHINSKRTSVVVKYDDLRRIELTSKPFWRDLELVRNSQHPILLNGLPRLGTRTLESAILNEKKQFHQTQNLFDEKAPTLKEMYKWIDDRLNGSSWVSYHQIEHLKNRTESLNLLFRILPSSLTEDEHMQKILKELPKTKDEIEHFRNESNRRFAKEELERFGSYFDTIEANPLTEAQRRAVLTHENRTLVVAGAGSGKTSVVVAKAGYLLKKGLCSPEQLLLIAFNRSAANEMQERIKKRIGYDVRATTFHELGLSIIGQTTGKKPSLAVTATDKQKLLEEIHQILTVLLSDKRYSKAVINYFGSNLVPYKSESDFETLGEYFEYVLEQELRTIRGELVKSLEELEIANFLFLNGVPYEYEKQYEIETATADFRQYEPDFYLPEPGIYIEHFGIGRDGSTAPYVDKEEYHAGMEWKRSIHEEYGTTLIETYSYQKWEGNLSGVLKDQLTQHGVVFRPLSPDEIVTVLNKDNQFSPFLDLVASFLNHFKGNGMSEEEVRNQASNRNLTTPRLDAFLKVFSPIFMHYQQNLQENNVIDFLDMIIDAASLVENGSYSSPYTNILVDEFQDISMGRGRLVAALAGQQPSHRLFCVGDDWQSIYRFAGSDISIMRNFEHQFGPSETVYLDRTFRFNDQIERIASRFVLKNPAQIPKTINTTRNESKSRVFIHFPELGNGDLLSNALGMISHEKSDASVLILGRYNYLQNGIDWHGINRMYSDLSCKYQTVHSSKGTEADYVVILGIVKGKYGFPSEIVDDPILESVLSDSEKYGHAEERRLFYVGLTRARHAVHLISASAASSAFIRELMEDGSNVGIFGLPSSKPVRCNKCKSGEMILRTGPYGNFYGCSNFPLCDFKAEVCPACSSGYLILQRGIYECNSKHCDFSARQCPECETGRLVERQGKYGTFIGCTNFTTEECNYTEKKASSEN
ncbi:MAG: UvrD-helicase domain-containing protein [Candidatus Thorarchaeota archaeon]